MSAGSTEDFQRDVQERRTSTPGDEERKQRILDNGLECLRRLHGDQTWEDWMGAGAAMMIVTEEASAEVGASRWDKDNKRLVREFNRRWEEYEARLRSNHKTLTKQERWALREVMTNAEIGSWRSKLDGPEKRKLNHPNAVVNRWKASTRTHEPRQMRQPSPALRPVTKPVTEPVTKPAGHDHAALVQELAQAKARIAKLEMQLAHRDAELTRERSTRAAAEAKHSKPGGTVDDEDPAAVGPMGKRVFKLVLRLDSPNDNEVLLAAQKLVRELKANGSDLRTLAAALETEWEKQQKAKPASPPPIDYSEVEAAVTRYAADRTMVNLNRMWKALKVEVPALNAHHPGTTVAHYLMGCLRRLGFAGSSSRLTWHRT